MKIGIIGGGAIGLLFAAYLSVNHKVTVYTRTNIQAEMLQQKGLYLYRKNEKIRIVLQAKPISDGLDEQDIVLIAVKQYHLSEIVPIIAECKTPLLFLQNGYSHVAIMENMTASTVYVGVVEHGALRREMNVVEHTGIGLTKIACFKGNLSKLGNLSDDIPHFSFVEEMDYQSMLRTKLAVNAVINPLTAILKIENGQLIDNPYYRELFTAYVCEVAEILDMDQSGLNLHIKQVCRNTQKNRSSMLKDIENRRRTEIDSITGYLLTVATEKGKTHVISSVIYSMVKGMESQGG